MIRIKRTDKHSNNMNKHIEYSIKGASIVDDKQEQTLVVKNGEKYQL